MIKLHLRRRYWVLIIVCIVILLPVALSGYFVIRWAGKPVQQEITVHSSDTILPEQSSPQTVRTTYYSFQVPSGFKVRTSIDSANPRIVHTQAFESGTGSLMVGVTSNIWPSDGWSGIADYNLRTRTPAEYQPRSDISLPSSGKAFRKVGSAPEQTAFILHGARYASITASGGDTETVEELYTSVLASWQWL